MPTSCRAICLRVLAFVAGFSWIAFGGIAMAEDQPPRVHGEKVDVELKIVPFYAVDAEGRPVFDLRRDEVELKVGGAPVAIEAFDRYSTTGAASESPRKENTPPPAAARHVFFLVDVAFSSPRGLLGSSQVVKGYLEQLPATDRLYLLVNDRRTGLQEVLGPLAADAKGKEQVLERIHRLRPDIQGLQTNVELPPSIKGAARGPVPSDQDSATRDAARANSRTQYEGVARAFAGSLELLAAELRRLPGPKLLITFSQGFNPDLYFNGESIGLQTGSAAHHVDSRQFSALESHFRKPLQALADSGAMSLFVNVDHMMVVAGRDTDSALRHIASSAGGLYVEGMSPQVVEARMASSTAAYYEAGFVPAGSLLEAGRAGVEVVVHRPGVRVWAASAVRTRESYASLSEYEKRLLMIDVVQGGPEAQRSRSPVRLDLRDLAGHGRVQGHAQTKQILVRFEADWPADLAGKKVDLYTVVLSQPRRGAGIEVLQYDQKERASIADLRALETAIEGHDAFVWGVVAVEPGTERAWFRRLLVQGAKPGGGAVRQ